MLNTPTTSGDNGTPHAAAPVSVRVGTPGSGSQASSLPAASLASPPPHVMLVCSLFPKPA